MIHLRPPHSQHKGKVPAITCLVFAIAACGRLDFAPVGIAAEQPDAGEVAASAPNVMFVTSTTTTLDTLGSLAGC